MGVLLMCYLPIGHSTPLLVDTMGSPSSPTRPKLFWNVRGPTKTVKHDLSLHMTIIRHESCTYLSIYIYTHYIHNMYIYIYCKRFLASHICMCIYICIYILSYHIGVIWYSISYHITLYNHIISLFQHTIFYYITIYHIILYDII